MGPLKKLATADGVEIERHGNLLIATFLHPTAGVTETLSKCEASAVKT